MARLPARRFPEIRALAVCTRSNLLLISMSIKVCMLNLTKPFASVAGDSRRRHSTRREGLLVNLIAPLAKDVGTCHLGTDRALPIPGNEALADKILPDEVQEPIVVVHHFKVFPDRLHHAIAVTDMG